MDTNKTDLPDDGYINEFHKKWDEACQRTNAEMKSRHLTAEMLRAQSKRLEDHYRAKEEEEKAKK